MNTGAHYQVTLLNKSIISLIYNVGVNLFALGLTKTPNCKAAWIVWAPIDFLSSPDPFVFFDFLSILTILEGLCFEGTEKYC